MRFLPGWRFAHTNLRKTLLGWALLTIGGEPTGRALVPSLVTPQIGEFSFVLTTSGVALGIFRVLKQISCWQ